MLNNMNKYIFDTNCFYNISFKESELLNNDDNIYYSSLIQYNEIRNKQIDKKFTVVKKDRLLAIFKILDLKEMHTESFILGDISAGILGKSKLGTTGWFSKIKEDLNKLKNHKGNHNDALISEIAIKNNLILVTNDENLYDVIKNYYSDVITLTEFKKKLKFK
jgi:predicted nucleic acid-binding protein